MSIVISKATVDPMTVVALTGVVPTYEDEPQLWDQMIPLVEGLTPAGDFLCGVIEHSEEYVAHNPKLSVFLPVVEDTQVEPPLELHHFPARECLVADILGPYNQITAAYEELQQYLEAHGLAHRTDGTLAAKSFSLYFNTPEQVDESELRTRVCMPLG
ncbi:GyrI-like domain-containing protein [Corynebacterium canis]|uniref:GyrI-like domain-containing protein n=1 Tax=Corynebacterium canis TaxID=679663 RepID=A0A5C5TXE6_9CORY|nr:GyrI-like domain-containing protein [Corynebacterium canis]TWT18068.1 GyrI-like domain-containing protein [Corynebacterium canis]WJY74237.1 Bacterial transcription activator, effector binding domain [Corynebacterium canis]